MLRDDEWPNFLYNLSVSIRLYNDINVNINKIERQTPIWGDVGDNSK